MGNNSSSEEFCVQLLPPRSPFPEEAVTSSLEEFHDAPDDYDIDQEILDDTKLRFYPLDPAAVIPDRAYDGTSAGYDLYSLQDRVIPSRYCAEIKTGISVDFPRGTYGVIKSRSSMARFGVTVEAGVIDHGYTGELIVLLYNHRRQAYSISAQSKIAQLLILPFLECRTEVHPVDPNHVHRYSTSRGCGSFGSSGATA